METTYYHGTNAQFDPASIALGAGCGESSAWGLWLTTSADRAAQYGETVHSYRINGGRIADLDDTATRLEIAALLVNSGELADDAEASKWTDELDRYDPLDTDAAVWEANTAAYEALDSLGYDGVYHTAPNGDRATLVIWATSLVTVC